MTYYIFRCAAAFLFGLVMGEFTNTLEYRLRSDIPLLDANCYCTSCHGTVKLFEQLPVISYIKLGGKCRHCGAEIGIYYPIVEAVVALYYLAAAIISAPSVIFMLVIGYVGIAIYIVISHLIRGELQLRIKYLWGVLILIWYHLLIGIGIGFLNIAFDM
ncbi:MAG: prepilin peptidase [Clostridiales bacterium]|nr:prepilin peptidase [Clostridiales bacterium]